MAGLVTAWELTRGEWRERIESVTVYQRGWRLGGKGASSRGPFDRIEEHGLHVLLGYYDATFRVLREAYAELDRTRTDPGCPSGDVAGRAGAQRRRRPRRPGRQDWRSFVTRFSVADTLPGEPGAEDRPLQPLEVLARSVRLLWDFHRSTAPSVAGVSFSGSPSPPPPTSPPWCAGAGLTALAAVLEAVDRAARLAADTPVAASTADALAACWPPGATGSDPSSRPTTGLDARGPSSTSW